MHDTHMIITYIGLAIAYSFGLWAILDLYGYKLIHKFIYIPLFFITMTFLNIASVVIGMFLFPFLVVSYIECKCN